MYALLDPLIRATTLDLYRFLQWFGLQIITLSIDVPEELAWRSMNRECAVLDTRGFILLSTFDT
jgi:hypothetical protein